MTIQGAIAELQNLLEVDDVPFYYKGGIEKVIETIQMELADRKTEPTISKMEQVEDEPQTDCNGCKFVGTYDTEFPCANCSRKTKDYYAKDEPQGRSK